MVGSKLEMIIIPKYSLVLLVGPSGSGKSSLASKFFPKEEIYSSDGIRQEINGDFRNQKNFSLVFNILHRRVKEALSSGKRAVVDATNLRKKDRLVCVNDAQGIEVPIFYLIINRPIEEKIKTGGWRLEVDGLIERHDRMFRQYEAQILLGDGIATVIDTRKDDFVVEN